MLGGGKPPLGTGNIPGVLTGGVVGIMGEAGGCAVKISIFGGGIVPLAGITPFAGW
jgi:hypothetical protein